MQPVNKELQYHPQALRVITDNEMYLAKSSNLTQKGVSKLLRKYSCPYRGKSTHQLWECYALNGSFYIILKNITNSSTMTNSKMKVSTTNSTSQQGSSSVALTLPYAVTNDIECCCGFSTYHFTKHTNCHSDSY